MRRWENIVWIMGFWLAAGGGALGQIATTGEIVTLHQLIQLTPEQAAAGLPFRVRGVVVCYDAGWHQLYVHDQGESLYFNADDFAVQPKKGDLVEITGKITGKARGTNALENPSLVIVGQTALPAAVPLELSDLGRDHGEWVEVQGRVLSGESSRGRLALLLNDKGQNCLVYLLGTPGDQRFQTVAELPGAGARHQRQPHGRGPAWNPASCSRLAPTKSKSFEPAGAKPSQIPVVSIGSLLHRELGSWTNQWVHINGLVVSYRPGESLTVKDPTGVIRARVIQLTEIRGDERVDLWGFLEAGPDETFLNNSYFEVAQPPPQDLAAASPPSPLSRVARLPSVLTQVSDILQLRPEEAAQQLAVRLRGVITYADPEWRNGFLQDRGDAIYVDLDPAQKNVQSGQWVELTGRTSPGGFAPEVLERGNQSLGRDQPAHARARRSGGFGQWPFRFPLGRDGRLGAADGRAVGSCQFEPDDAQRPFQSHPSRV